MAHRPGAAALLLLLCWAPRGAADLDFAAFLAWASGRGAVLGAKLELGVDARTGLRGIRAAERVPSGTALFELPPGLVLSSDAAAQESEAYRSCSAAAGEGGPAFLAPIHSALAMFILEQRAVGAPWQPWVAALPEAIPSFPMTYGPEDLEGLQASPVRRVVELEQNSISQDFSVAREFMPQLTLEEYTWARTMVKSRVFGLRSLSGGELEQEVIAMVPLADFINHPLDGVVAANVAPSYDAKTGVFRVAATTDIEAGAGVYWDYGFKSNRHSLLRYGFVSKQRVALTDMPFMFRLTDFPGPPSAAKKMKFDFVQEAKQEGLLVAEDDGTVLHELTLSLTGPTMEKLLGHMRFMVLQAKNATAMREMCPGTVCGPVSLSNERQALQHLDALVQALSSSYTTSIAEDAALLDEGKVTPAEGARWQTLVVRYGEKQVLRGMRRLLQAMDPHFDLSPWALAKIVAERWNSTESDIHRYVQENITNLVEAETLRWARRRIKEDRARAQAA